MSSLTSERPETILVVDDDREIRDLLARFLSKHGYQVTAVCDGKEMHRALAEARIDLIVLDLMLPGEDGLSLCRAIRTNSAVPVIMLTALGEEGDRIVGLEMGADDYLPKPFSARELLARIKAVLRRIHSFDGHDRQTRRTVLRFADWTLDLSRRQLESPQRVIVDLSAGEFDLLVALAQHPQRVLSRDLLLDLTRGRTAAPFDRSVDVQIGRLRRKIEADPKQPELIKTVRSGGYMFTPAVERA